MKAIILSAGQGRRLLPRAAHVPKCALCLRGRSLIGWQIDTLFEPAVVVRLLESSEHGVTLTVNTKRA